MKGMPREEGLKTTEGSEMTNLSFVTFVWIFRKCHSQSFPIPVDVLGQFPARTTLSDGGAFVVVVFGDFVRSVLLG